MKQTFELKNGHKVELTVKVCDCGTGITVFAKHLNTKVDSTTVTCTCYDDAGNSYTTTKQCPDGSNETCDCSTPSSPKITCE